ncbi:MAG: Smr/MutS family protein [Candidatus Odinarchaeota archaeon]
MIKCDLHGFRLFEAIEEILDVLEDCLSSGDKNLFIIHGYRNGQVLKNYVRSKKFIQDMASEGYILKEVNLPNPGASMFKVI